MKPGKWQRNIVSIQVVSSSDDVVLRLFAVDNDGKAWVMISDASKLMEGYNRAEPQRLLENEWLPIKPLPQDRSAAQENWSGFHLLDQSLNQRLVDEISPEVFIAAGISLDEALALAEILTRIVVEDLEPQPIVFSVESDVMVYDRYRFAFPLPGVITKIGENNDGMEVELLASNNNDYPIGCKIWVHYNQLRLARGKYDPSQHHKPYKLDQDQLVDRKNRAVLDLYLAVRDLQIEKVDMICDLGIKEALEDHPHIQMMIDNGTIKAL